jgi:hypothetical protein
VAVVAQQVLTVLVVAVSAGLGGHNPPQEPVESVVVEQVVLEAVVTEVMDPVVVEFRPLVDWDLVMVAAVSFAAAMPVVAVVVEDILVEVAVAEIPQEPVPVAVLVISAARALPVARLPQAAAVLRVIMPMPIEVLQELEELVPEVVTVVDLSSRKTINIGNT